jgi:hypothetical protein
VLVLFGLQLSELTNYAETKNFGLIVSVKDIFICKPSPMT